MKTNVALKLAASTLVIGITMVGCKSAGSRPSSGWMKAASADKGSAKLYARAQEAVQAGNMAEALRLAEQTVELSPRDSGYRMLLADLYLKNGRFVSAETAFGDVLALDPGNQRAGLSRVLAMIGQGKNKQAGLELDRLAGSAAPADVGLAFALAGQPQRAVEMLEPAAREQGATARVRQNLALSYALAGDWKKARMVASQDLSPAEVASRLEQWAALANPSAPHVQVATLLGVTPVEDAGQPVRLALAPAVPAQQALAAAATLPAPVAQAAAERPAPVTPTAYAQADTTPAPAPVAAPAPVVVTAPVAAPVFVAAPAPVALPAPVAAPAPATAPAVVAAPVPDASPVQEPVAVAQAPVEMPLPPAPGEQPARGESLAVQSPDSLHRFSAPAPAMPDLVSVPATSAKRAKRLAGTQVAAAVQSLVRSPAPAIRASAKKASEPLRTFARARFTQTPQTSRARGGRYVVQLGAYRNAQQVEEAWVRAQKRYGFNNSVPVSTTVTIPGKGTFHRLSVAGFGNSADANSLCESIRSRQGVCFVRVTAGDAPIQWASGQANRRG